MQIIGSTAVAAYLSTIPDRVAGGEEFTITQGGKPVAMLLPSRSAEAVLAPVRTPEEVAVIRAAVEEMKQLRKGRTLGPGLTIREMIDEGRR